MPFVLTFMHTFRLDYRLYNLILDAVSLNFMRKIMSRTDAFIFNIFSNSNGDLLDENICCLKCLQTVFARTKKWPKSDKISRLKDT